MGLRLVARDMWRILRGGGAFFRYLFAKEDLEVGLGRFSAASHLARRGQPNQYVVRVANASHTPATFVLRMSIQADRVSNSSREDDAYFAKKLTVQPCTSSTITIQYDWMFTADFQIDGVSTPPDDFWRGGIDTAQLYAITALLQDAQGTRLDGLTVFQELTD